MPSTSVTYIRYWLLVVWEFDTHNNSAHRPNWYHHPDLKHYSHCCHRLTNVTLSIPKLQYAIKKKLQPTYTVYTTYTHYFFPGGDSLAGLTGLFSVKPDSSTPGWISSFTHASTQRLANMRLMFATHLISFLGLDLRYTTNQLSLPYRQY